MPIAPRNDAPADPAAPAVPLDTSTPKLEPGDGVEKTAVQADASGNATLNSAATPASPQPTNTTPIPANELPKPGEPIADKDAEGLTGTGTDNSSAEPVAQTQLPSGVTGTEPNFAPGEFSNPTAVPPAPPLQAGDRGANPVNVSPSIATPATPPVGGTGEAGEMASAGFPGENEKLRSVKLSDLPTIHDPADIKALKDGDLFLAAFICSPESDKAWHASQIMGDLLSGRNIMGGLSKLYWQHHYKNRPPIGQKQGTNYVMLD